MTYSPRACDPSIVAIDLSLFITISSLFSPSKNYIKYLGDIQKKCKQSVFILGILRSINTKQLLYHLSKCGRVEEKSKSFLTFSCISQYNCLKFAAG